MSPETGQLDRAFSALADPTRRAILTRLARGEAAAGELGEPFDISQPAVSRHLKVLERAGLISRRVDAQWRRFHLRPEGLRPVAAWIERYRRFWEARFDSLERYVSELAPETEDEDGSGPED